ncbi:ATP-binding protein [Thermoactinomyces sp. DSM 45892]|uniref:ATP-binding protein n=1 Tax=Thermoactinomyces sp. DSM 45892 TaxID=1882753 RepID=UPI000894B18C|nr:ATP-binding protein [Thermoactinomyces sp. DSM 45892]SDY87535.1 AAA-like domain-containing protein [Thermoactinomyces sp. DSM 45892]
MNFSDTRVPTQIVENIAFFKESNPVAFYGYLFTPYPSKSMDEKKGKWGKDVRLFTYLQENGYQVRMWRVKVPDTYHVQLDNLVKSIGDEHAEVAAQKIFDQWKYVVDSNVAPKYITIFGVELPNKTKVKDQDNTTGHVFRWFQRGLGIGGDQVFNDELEKAFEEDKKVEKRIGVDVFSSSMVRLLPHEICNYVYRHHTYRGMEMPPLPEWMKRDFPMKKKAYTWLCEAQVTEYHDCVQIDHDNDQRFLSFITVASLPDTIEMPGDELLYKVPLRCKGYNVDSMLHYTHIPPVETREFAKAKQRDVNDEVSHVLEGNIHPSMEMLEKHEEVEAFAEYIRKSEVPMLHSHIVFCVDGRTREEVNLNAKNLIQKLEGFQLIGYQPSNIQLELYQNWLPGPWDSKIGYDEPMLPEIAATFASPGSADLLGTASGVPLGFTEYDALVSLDIALGPQNNKDAGLGIVGPLGSGKSFLINTLIYYAALVWRAKVFVIDIKEERTHWVKTMPGLEENVYRLVLDGRQRPGSMDPFLRMEDKEMARAVAVSMIGLMRKRGLEDDENTVLLSAAKKAVENEKLHGIKASMRRMMEHLEADTRPVAQQISGFLKEVADLPQGKLLFGDREKEQEAIQDDLFANEDLPEYGIVLLQLAGLKLPNPNKTRESMELDERVTLAVMMSTAILAESFVLRDRSKFKVAALDEAWAWLRTELGNELANKLQRAGRSANAGIWYATQKPSDLKDVVDLMSTYVCLGTTSEEETTLAIEALRMQDTKEVREKLQNVRSNDSRSSNREFARVAQAQAAQTSKGYLRDLDGRSGYCEFVLPDEQLSEIFNTKPEAVAASKV